MYLHVEQNTTSWYNKREEKMKTKCCAEAAVDMLSLDPYIFG